jgi:RNA polymerase sigma-70 factor, ECF subfamily
VRSFDDIFATFRSRVFALSLHVTADESDAQDATQETFVAIWRGLSRFRGDSALSTWIYRIAIRSALRVRARRPQTETLAFEPVGEDRNPALESERSRQVRRALSRLTADHRTVLALFSLDGLSHQEIAETLGIPEGTVWSRLHLARKKLSAELRALGVDF